MQTMVVRAVAVLGLLVVLGAPARAEALTSVTAAAGPPSAPTAVTAATSASGSAVVAWGAPVDAGGSAITGYRVVGTPGDRLCLATTVRSCTVTGLTDGVAVTFTVVATNTTGPGAPSSPSNAVTPIRYRDVPTGSPFSADIDWLGLHHLSNGFDDGTFRPDLPVTRAAVAAILYRFAGVPDGLRPTCASPPFIDVPAASPFCGEIAWLTAQHIATGFTDGSFHPDAPVSREALAAFLYRLAHSPDGARPTCATAPFGDVPTTAPLCGEIAWFAAHHLTTGYAGGSFRPGSPVGRDALAAFVHRFTAVVPLTCCTAFDFDGDGKADQLSHRVPRVGGTTTVDWYLPGATTPFRSDPEGSRPIAGDFDGDGRWEPGSVDAAGVWRLGGGAGSISFPRPAGAGVDLDTSPYAIAVPGDYLGEGHARPAWFRNTDATWFIQGEAPIQFGAGPTGPTVPASEVSLRDEDVPVPADYDGDGTTDLATYRPTTGLWKIRSSHDGAVRTVTVATPGRVTLPVPADYDGVGHAQPAVFDFLVGWSIEGHTNPTSTLGTYRGTPGGSFPAPADYHGTGSAQLSFVDEQFTQLQTWTIAGDQATVVVPTEAIPVEEGDNVTINLPRITLLGYCLAGTYTC